MRPLALRRLCYRCTCLGRPFLFVRRRSIGQEHDGALHGLLGRFRNGSQAFTTYYEIGSPKHPGQLAERLGSYAVTAQQAQAAQNLHQCSVVPPAKTLYEAIEALRHKTSFDDVLAFNASTACEVDPARVAPPAQAAVLDLAEVLPRLSENSWKSCPG